MNDVMLTDYVIIGQLPDGKVVTLRSTTTPLGRELYAEQIEAEVLESFRDQYPDVIIPLPDAKKGTSGGAGWSKPYRMGSDR